MKIRFKQLIMQFPCVVLGLLCLSTKNSKTLFELLPCPKVAKGTKKFPEWSLEASKRKFIFGGDKVPPIPKVLNILETLVSVGLGYLQLGQEIASLSGGEAQRLRLARELAKRSTGKTLYLFDEPTIGLHSEDILKLLKIFHALVDKGNTVLIIEHNLEVIKNADYLIDIGPEAGIRGGEIVCMGTPEEVAKHKTSYTAKYLKPILK